LGESSGSTAASSVLANEQSDSATYSNVSLGQPGPLTGSSGTAAGFNGTSSYVDLTQGVPTKALIGDSSFQTISMWFKTSTVNGVLFSYQDDPITMTETGSYVPALYVGADGKLVGLLWCNGCGVPMMSSGSVADGLWHHVVLTGGGNTQSMYLDGGLVASRSGLIQLFNAMGRSTSMWGRGSSVGCGRMNRIRARRAIRGSRSILPGRSLMCPSSTGG
jgi:hypothetical protein